MIRKAPVGPISYGIMVSMTTVGPDVRALSEAEQAWLRQSEARWRRAHAIAAAHPGMDSGDVYHALVSLDLTPSERLHRGLTRVRRRPHAG